jgi:endogenous inhibitor of DNA gyrase (YacG/DUF329 family)
MSIESRVARLERASGADGPCPLCERRAASVESSPVLRPGLVETPGDTYTLNCPGCGTPFTLQVVYVERKEAA